MITIGRRFNGPPDSGNGGYTCGLVAGALGGGPAEVMLKAPPPLDRPLAIEGSDDGVVVRDGEQVVAQGRHATVDFEPPATVAADVAAAAEGGPFLDAEQHPFPSCFVCGPLRSEGDGLRIFVGPIDPGVIDPVFATVWTPPASLAGADGALPEELVWAALDCPSGWAIDTFGREGVLLGRLAVRILEPPRGGAPHVVLGWPLGAEGRKRLAGSGLVTADGQTIAFARSTWLVPRAA